MSSLPRVLHCACTARVGRFQVDTQALLTSNIQIVKHLPQDF